MSSKDPIIKSGYLDVGDGHQIYWEDWGNPKATPIFSLHGGPGSNFNESHKAIFDPNIHRVIFHDQRGSGKSKPFASIEHNTTQNLVEDIEKLRESLGISSMHVVGGSWGSALSLIYAINHPKRVKSLLIWGVYLIREFEEDWVNEGYPRYHFPQEWERFISLVPPANRKSGVSIMKYFYNKMHSKDEKEAKFYAIEWTLWESVLLSIDYDPQTLEKEIKEDPGTLSIALLETHYFLNGCFVPRNFILDNIDKIKHIPCYVEQGRFDMCTPAISAYDLSKAYGKKLKLEWVNSGHLRSDPKMREALKAKTLEIFK
ncbi:MAG TPA: prolyl aminopeptidase [Patescibacteria group bacterium]|nr:prolyl aminopeptidase [Patescibacteria group bacterium]